MVTNFLSSIKYPDGFASNISRCIKGGEFKMSSMKSHDYHIFLQRVLPLRDSLTKEVRQIVLELSSFFKKLCSRTSYVHILEEEVNNIAIILCKMEKIFPHSFFDIMLHLMVHLPLEAKLAGPPQFRWMFPFERKMGTLKGYVTNNARPEGCIVEHYIDKECLTFCSMYLRNVETTFNTMVGPGKRGLGKKLVKPSDSNSHPSPRRSSRLTPTRATPNFNLRDENEEPEQELTPRRSSRLVLVKRALELTTESGGTHKQARGEFSQPSHVEELHEQHQQLQTPKVLKRGSTRNIGLANKKRGDKPLIVEFDDVSKRIVGQDAEEFITELGCVVRKLARFNKRNFASQEEKLKDEIIRNTSNDPLAQECIKKQLASQFKSQKHVLHGIYMRYGSKEKALKHVPEDIREEDWTFLCNHFDSEEYKKICARNAKNRAKVKVPSTIGTKSLARSVNEKMKANEDMSPIEIYRMAHYSKENKAMINEEAQQHMDKMTKLQETTSLSHSDICLQELGAIPGCSRGRPSSSKKVLAIEKRQDEIEKEKQRANEAEKKAAAMVEEVNAPKEEIKQLKDLHQQSNEKMKMLMREVARLVRLHSDKN